MSFRVPVIQGVYRVVEIIHNEVPVYVGLERRAHRSSIGWQVREVVENPLMTFLRGLNSPQRHSTHWALGCLSLLPTA